MTERIRRDSSVSVISFGDQMNINEMTHLKHQAQGQVLSRESNPLLGLLGLGAPHGEPNLKVPSNTPFPRLGCFLSSSFLSSPRPQLFSRTRLLADFSIWEEAVFWENLEGQPRAASDVRCAGEEGAVLWGLSHTPELWEVSAPH